LAEREPPKNDSQLIPTSAVLDTAHVGDIQGAFGTIRVSDVTPRRSWRRRLLTLAAIVGPGIIVMVGDNDAGGVSTYAQAGQNYGYSLLWTLILLIPVLIVNQEMVVRLGAVTGVGHARLINERFGRFWGWFSVGDLFLLNFLTIVTEFIGITLASEYFGFPRLVVVPLAALILISITISGNFRRWERAMFVFLAASLLVLPLVLLSHPDPGAILKGLVVPDILGGFTSNAALLIIAIVGTTVAPWQLFFQQSNVVDKRITPRWLEYEKADTVIGAFVVVIGAAAIMMAAASAFSGTSDFGNFVDAKATAFGLRHHIGPVVGAIFALLLFDASIVGASAVTLATSYAFGDVFGLHHSLHRGIREARAFYGTYAGMVVVAAAITLVSAPYFGLITTAVQALAGILLPSASVFLVLLCNDSEVLGPWINRPWLNVVATIIVSILLELSLILVVSTILPNLNFGMLVIVLSSVVGLAMVVATVLILRSQVQIPTMSPGEKENWRMPGLALLQHPQWSLGRRVAILALRGYLVIAVLLLVVKAIQIALHR
jgi:NRAMP (natural resistance-associated macrophage protein)-like metal ion transporter